MPNSCFEYFMSISLYPPTPALAMAGAAPGTTFGVDFNRLLELPRNVPNRLLELPNYGLWQAKSFLFYRPATAGCSLQTLQALRNVQTGSWSCHETKPAKPALGAAKLWAVAGQVFPFKRSEPSKLAPGAATKPAKPNYGLWQAKSFLVYRPETAGCSLQTLQTLRNFQTGSWSCHETGQTGSWSCQTMGCGRPRLSFSTGPKLPDAPVKPSKRSETSKPAPGAATKPAKPALGAAKLWALAGQVFPFLPARNCRMLPSNPPNAPKLPNRLLELPQNLPHRLLELPNYGLWQAKSFLFYRPETARSRRQPGQPGMVTWTRTSGSSWRASGNEFCCESCPLSRVEEKHVHNFSSYISSPFLPIIPQDTYDPNLSWFHSSIFVAFIPKLC